MKKLSAEQRDKVINTLKSRFLQYPNRHKGFEWSAVETKLKASEEKLWSINEMESSGGEPDVIGFDKESGKFTFCDCSAESPVGRRSLCYDEEALSSRKENKPIGSAKGVAAEMGIELLTEAEYRKLQSLGEFDRKTSSWLNTPEKIRKLGGAIFGDYRFDNVFVYHNGVQSYYGGRGFRGCIIL